tara:strand:+ start:380 stop:631 length:252 start_codon:yes stop_codon:yes gene_type:complete
MTEKIDTQGMSGEVVKGCMDNVYPHDANGNPIYPPANFKQWPIFNDKERAELKGIMLEALKEFHGDSFDSREAPMWTLDEFQE